jgi:hypothetical protein
MSWQKKSLLYLKEVCKDFLAAQSKTGSVTVGIPESGLPTTIAILDLYISNLEGYPSYREDGLLQTGHIVATKYKQTSISDMQSDTSDVLDELIKYLYDNVSMHSPTIDTVPGYWVWIDEITPRGYDVGDTAFDNSIYIEIVFTNGVISPD